jgi:renalase
MTKKSSLPLPESAARRNIAVVGAGIAGIACARTLAQAGHEVTVFEKSREAGGRMATRDSEFGGFDHGTQYFTVRDARFEKALATASGLVRPWSANTVRILDELGRVVASALPPKEAHWVATPGMNALVGNGRQPSGGRGPLCSWKPK